MKESQDMIDFAVKHNITIDIEVIPVDYVNTALERLEKNDVKYRLVIDVANTLNVATMFKIVEEYTSGNIKPYGVEEMTFLKEDEVFLTITILDASENIEDDSKASVSADSLKDETNEAINTHVEADKKKEAFR
ncbi:hypothetical protein RJT34_01874 [Clitoria ternatea]|uniref:Uncharacterized protein n=1 Tax=Clitoria ternatea TaxID=43366 RepID=A0AAN9KJS2_CLITE